MSSRRVMICTRRGMAPLEFVMGLPFLLLLFSFFFSLGFAFLNKTTVAINARHEVWQAREDQSHWSNDALSIFSALNDDSGVHEKELQQDVKIAQWLGGALTVKSKAAVLTGTWDSRQIPTFDEGDPHTRLMEKMLGSNLGLLGVGDSILHKLLTLSLDDPDGAIQAANEEKNAAEKERDKQIQKMEKEIARLKQELDTLKQERQKLQDEYDALRAERDALKQKQTDLRNQAENFPMGSPQRQKLLDQANALNPEITNLEAKMNTKANEIAAKDKEIRAKEKEIAEWEKQLNDAKAELNNVS